MYNGSLPSLQIGGRRAERGEAQTAARMKETRQENDKDKAKEGDEQPFLSKEEKLSGQRYKETCT